MVDRLKNKTALVTGATSNIGRAIALAFAREGAHVVVGGRDAERANAVGCAIRASGGKANVALGDQDGGQAAAQSLAEEATRLLGGRVDILVNNAGIYPFHTTATSDEAMFDRIFAVNVRAPFFLTQALAPGMAARGGGVIINLGSWITHFGQKQGLPGYTRLTEPDGPIYMAGDHVTHLVGWQEGAALSAHRVVTKIDQAFGGRPAQPAMSARAVWA